MLARDPHMKNESETLIKVLNFLEDRVSYCIVGDVRRLPDDTSKDIDFVVNTRDLRMIPKLLEEFCEKQECKLIQSLQHESVATYYVICWRGENGGQSFLQLDFCSDYLRYARPLLMAGELLVGAVSYSRSVSGISFPVPMPQKAFIYYLLKRVDKRQLTADNGEYLSEQYALDPKGAEEEIRRFWPDSEACELLLAALSGDWSKIIEDSDRFQQMIQTSSVIKARFDSVEILRIVARIFNPAGLLVVITGLTAEDYQQLSTVLQKNLLRGFRNAMDAEGVSRNIVVWKVIRSTLIISRKNLKLPFIPRLVISVDLQKRISAVDLYPHEYSKGVFRNVISHSVGTSSDLASVVCEIVILYMEDRVKKFLRL